ncbi:MAG: HIT domain-containing protein [Methylococcales bacterium]|nr:HIT domain-containing protein [Methylococcales bacterium]
MTFQLHPQLAQDCAFVTEFTLSHLLLLNERRFPWLVLVPKVPDIREIYQLNQQQRLQLMDESCWLAERLQAIFQPDKLNIASIGNKVPQLHIHHVVRYQGDCAWPETVWSHATRERYSEAQIADQVAELKQALQLRGAVNTSV